jgi:RHS repeat-associated protein
LTAVTYTYNKGSQLGSLQDWAGRSVAYMYWPDGLVKSAANPDASSANYAYDNARRLVDIAHAGSTGQLIDRSFYTLNQVGSVTNVNHGLLAAQVARPDGLVGSNGTWTGTYASINEVVPNDSTFLASPSSPASPNYYEVSLSNIQPPMDKTAIKIHYRIAKSGNNSGQTISLLVELRQGSTVIYSGSYQSLPGATGSGWLDDTITVSAQQAQTITDYNDLRLRFTPTSSGGGQARKAQISWVEVNVPSPADPTAATSYTYDGLSRLSGSSGQNGTVAYGYDPVDNRTSVTAAGTTTYTYDRADRMTAAGAAAVTVDANGNTTVRGSDTFAFDQSNRLKTATVSGSTETYQYGADGLRFSRQIGTGTPIRYVSDVGKSLPVTIDDGTRKYVYGIGLVYAVTGTTVEAYHTDRVGSVRAITTNGAVVATYRTDDWGNVLSQTGSSSQPFGFIGELRDGSGLTYLRARYYDPSLGRFTTRDPLSGWAWLPPSLNRYAYARNGPSVYLDPTGLFTIGLCLGVDFNFFGIGGEGQFCLVASTSLEVGLTWSRGGGFIAAPTISGSFTAQVSNANCVEDLAGWFGNVGAGGGVGLGVQGSGFGGWSPRTGQPIGGGTFGVAFGAGATARGTATYTEVIGSIGRRGNGCKSTVLR